MRVPFWMGREEILCHGQPGIIIYVQEISLLPTDQKPSHVSGTAGIASVSL